MQSTVRRRTVGTLVAASILALMAPARPASAISTTLPMNGIASLSTANKAGNKASFDPSVSSGGRFIAFASTSTDLVGGDANGKADVFVRDTLADTTTLVSTSSQGGQGNGDSGKPSISSDGRYVAFESKAANLVANDTNGTSDVFIRDLVGKTTIRASLRSTGAQSNGTGEWPTISDDGKHVAFQSDDNAMVFGEGNGKIDSFVRDTQNGTTVRVSVDTSEASLTAGGSDPSISGNGQYVVFTSTTNQIGTDTNNQADVFLRDVLNGTTERVSITSSGASPTGQSIDGTVSDDGRYVAYQSDAHNMTADDTGPTYDGIYRRDRNAGTTALAVRSFAGTAAGGGAAGPDISADGKKVAFISSASNLVAGDTNGKDDAFVRDLTTSTTTKVSTTTTGAPLNSWSSGPSISPDGTVTAYQTFASNAFSPDANGTADVFYRGRYQEGPFSTSLQMLQQQAKDFNGVNLTTPQAVAMNDRLLLGVRGSGGAIVDFAHGSFDDHRGPVIRLYWAFFERLPDQGGLDYWVNKKSGGMTLKQIATSFAKSSEFKNKYGPLSDTAFITLVYQNVLERNPDQAGLDHWVERLQAGVPRGEMMTAFSESAEGIRRMRGEADTILLYLGMLRRLPTKSEFTTAVSFLEGSGSIPAQPSELIATDMLASTAYANRLASS